MVSVGFVFLIVCYFLLAKDKSDMSENAANAFAYIMAIIAVVSGMVFLIGLLLMVAGK